MATATSHSRISLVVFALALCSTAADAAKPALCPDGRFVVQNDAVLVAGAPTPNVLVVSGGTLAIASACDAAPGTVKAARKGTRLIGHWKPCGEIARVKLKGMLPAPDCTTVTGIVKAKKTPKVRFTAVRSRCGDGVVDAGGGEQCEDDAACSGGTCSDACRCEPTGTTTTTLPPDPSLPSIALINAAHDALAGGDDEVTLSPDGSWVYRRTRTGATLVTEELERDGQTVLSWDHGGGTSAGAVDTDADGTVERRHAVSGAPSTHVVTDDPEDDGSPTRRTTYSIGASKIHVVVEEADENGDLVEIEEFDADPAQFAEAPAANPVTPAASDCTPAQMQQIESLFQQAWATGTQCFKDLGKEDEVNFLTWKLTIDRIAFTCAELPQDFCAQIDISDSIFRGNLPVSVGVTIDPRWFFGNQTCVKNQQNVLWHELLHVTYGPHLPGHTVTDDPTYACTALCFNKTQSPKATKCQCATCLATDPCDPRCDQYADCGQSCELHAQIETSECVGTPCSCGPAGGNWYTYRATGNARGDVGTVLRVNAPKSLNGTLACGSWTPVTCPTNDTLVCCARQTQGQAASTTFTAEFPIFGGPLCVCGDPKPGTYNFVAQAIGTTMGVEDEQETTACQ